MKSVQTILPINWIKFFCVAAAIYAVSVAAYLFNETGKPLGARDYHQFWYAGQFIIQERDPYEAFFDGERPNLPIHYVDGVTVSQYTGHAPHAHTICIFLLVDSKVVIPCS